MTITPGQAAELAHHLATCHGQVRITAEEAADPGFLLALHRVARDQNPDEDGPACAPYTHRQTAEARELHARVTSHRGPDVTVTDTGDGWHGGPGIARFGAGDYGDA